jgi:uncharacterized membrane protein
MKKLNQLTLLFILTTQLLTAQSVESLKIKKYTQKNAHKIITEFSDFLSLPNVASDPLSQI